MEPIGQLYVFRILTIGNPFKMYLTSLPFRTRYICILHPSKGKSLLIVKYEKALLTCQSSTVIFREEIRHDNLYKSRNDVFISIYLNTKPHLICMHDYVEICPYLRIILPFWFFFSFSTITLISLSINISIILRTEL